MKYGLNSPLMAGAIDRHVTGGFPEDSDNLECCHCGADIVPGDTYFAIGNRIYCMDCTGHAEDDILDQVRDDYIFEL